jgi:hypothetical protein
MGENRAALIGVVVVAVALRVAWLLRGPAVVDLLFVPDDTYYLLAIARSLAHGLGPTADGVTWTSGFQPLAAFLLIPAFWVDVDALTAAGLLETLADVATCVLLVQLGSLYGSRRGGLLAAAVWAVSPAAVQLAMAGLETSLAIALQLGLVVAWWRMEQRGRGRLVVGVLAGLALLARIDSAFLIAALGIRSLLRREWTHVAVAGCVALTVVAPWWLLCWSRLGSPIPESGAATMAIVDANRELWLTPGAAVGCASAAILGPPYLRPLAFAPPFAAVTWGAACVILSAAAFVSRRTPLTALVAHLAALLLFYTWVVPAVWHFARYLAPFGPVVALGVAIAVVQRDRILARMASGVLVVVPLAVTLFGLFDPSPQRRNDGLAGYAAPAQKVLDLVPSGAVVGSMQSGALAYFARPPTRVVNLDGVVDAGASAALRERRHYAFARERGVTYIADWPPVLQIFLRRSGAPDEVRGLSPVGSADNVLVVKMGP